MSPTPENQVSKDSRPIEGGGRLEMGEGTRRDKLDDEFAEMLWALHRQELAVKKPGPPTECYWHELGCDLCKEHNSTARTF
ncbi:hypothetical protein B0H11DRAFT_2218483 [Mycena galericulata]|nr:hypothetical protein B0H11DRAFT_2258646 [Mycena galericulata]KAJ7507642.1 hypothetical protein B0H11DRAFT_2218483 [Mycena galericulata]